MSNDILRELAACKASDPYRTKAWIPHMRGKWMTVNVPAELWERIQAAAAAGVTAWCTLCGKSDHAEAACPTVTSGVGECFPMLDPNVPEFGSRYPDKGCYRVGCPIHGGPDGVGGLASFRTAQALAERFHEAYERLAPSFGYTTRTETRAFDPQSANGRLMVAVCQELLAAGGTPCDELGYATRLAEAIWRKHYQQNAPEWKPLPDLMGVLTQIDNMTSGLTRGVTGAPEPSEAQVQAAVKAMLDDGWKLDALELTETMRRVLRAAAGVPACDRGQAPEGRSE